MWIAVVEAEDGSWNSDPIGADTRDEVVEIATDKWSGKLGPGEAIALYLCHLEDTLDLPLAPQSAREPEYR